MKSHPELFTGPNVVAILEGRKTQTRRVIRPQPVELSPRMHENLAEPWHWVHEDADECHLFEHHKKPRRPGWMYVSWAKCTHPGDIGSRDVLVKPQTVWRCPYGVPGDKLYVRETWAHVLPEHFHTATVGYRADYSEDEAKLIKWKPSIHMPRWASRLSLEVTEVRVEKVQDISEEDAKAEGVMEMGTVDRGGYYSGFADLWDSINLKRGYSWESNPFCWVISFRRLDKADISDMCSPTASRYVRPATRRRPPMDATPANNVNPWVFAVTFERIEA